MNKKIIIISIYTLSGILAFGHSCSNSFIKGEYYEKVELVAIIGVVAGALNPLYWSWCFFENMEEDK